MMPIPTLPTDSLYKFMSVGGLICCLASITFFFWAVQQFVHERNALQGALHERSEQLLQLKSQIHDIEFEIAQQSDNWNDAARAAKSRKLAATQERSAAIEEEVLTRKRGLEKNGENIISGLGLCGNVTLVLGLCSFVIAVVGFSRWYLKIQQLQDAILKYEHESLLRQYSAVPPAESVGTG